MPDVTSPRPVEAWTIPEVAEMFKLSREYVAKRAAAGEWPSRRYGRRVLFLLEDVEQIKDLGRVTPTPVAGAGLSRVRRRRAS